MSRRFQTALVASHLVVLLGGAALAWKLSGHSGVSHQDSAAAKLARSELSAGHDAHGKPFFPTAEWSGIEYARAWKAVGNGKYSTRERIRLQRDLLENWALLDLPAAIEAALGEAWDRDGGGYYEACGPLLDVFSASLARDPVTGWELICGRQFGVGSGMLRRVWMEAVGAGDPEFLARRLAGLSWRDRGLAVDICRRAVEAQANASVRVALFEVLAAYPPEMLGAEQLMDFASLPDGPVDLAELKAEIIRLGSSDERMARVKAMLFGKLLADVPAEEVAAATDDLPDFVRAGVLSAAFMAADKLENVLGLADLLLDVEAWAVLQDPQTALHLQQVARDGGTAEVAQWATSLPVREETMALFDRCVEAYFTDNLKSARAWLDGIPSGVWRERALAEYSKIALEVHGNTRASRWALDRITATAIRSEAEESRTHWEQRSGWTGK